MQGISGRSHPDGSGLQALNNTADGTLQLACRVKIDEKKVIIIFYHLGIIPIILNFS